MTFHVYIISPPWHLTADVFVYSPFPHRIKKKKKSDVSFHLFFVEPQKSGGETYCAFDKRVVGEHEDTEVPIAI